jgi:hypothetical protein
MPTQAIKALAPEKGRQMDQMRELCGQRLVIERGVLRRQGQERVIAGKGTFKCNAEG